VFRALLLASGLLIVSLPSEAQYVYVWRDAAGTVTYSDSPPVGGDVGQVRRLRVRTFTATEGGSVAPFSSVPSINTVDQVRSIASGRARGQLPSETDGGSSSSGNSGDGGLIGGGSSGGGTSIAGGSGSEGGGGPLVGGTTSTASSAPKLAVPISTAPAPDLAVPISTAPAPDLAVPISTASFNDTISTTPTPSGETPVSSNPSSSSTSSQVAGGIGSSAQATLYWDEVTAPNIAVIPVAGYRVYYGTGPGSYLQPLGQGVDAGKVTSYTVQGLTSGTRYYFAVTTYVGGSESTHSNEVFKDIP